MGSKYFYILNKVHFIDLQNYLQYWLDKHTLLWSFFVDDFLSVTFS